MGRYRCALVGCGRVGSLLENDRLRPKPCTHAGAFHVHPGCELVAGSDIDPERLESFGTDWNIEENHLYTDYRKLFVSEKPDIVSLALDTESHSEAIIAAVQSGVKAIICEKPIDNDLKAASDAVRKCEEKGVVLAISHQRRFFGNYLAVKDYLASGRLGEVKTIVGWVLSSGGSSAGPGSGIQGGALLHDGTHMFDIIRFLFGDFSWIEAEVRGSANGSGPERQARCWFELKNGVGGMIEAGGYREYFHFELDIHGTKGRINIGNGIGRLFLSGESRLYEGFNDLIEQPGFIEPKHRLNPYLAQLDDLIQVIEGEKGGLVSDGRDGLEALRVITLAYQSASENSRRIYL